MLVSLHWLWVLRFKRWDEGSRWNGVQRGGYMIWIGFWDNIRRLDVAGNGIEEGKSVSTHYTKSNDSP